MHPPEMRARAKELNDLRRNPKRVQDALEDEFGIRPDYRTLKSWADTEGWKPWRDIDTPKELNPNKEAGVSGIKDPIYHLSQVLGRRLVREDPGTRSDAKEYGTRPSVIVNKALEEVDRQYDPGPDTIDYLRPILMRYVTAIKKGKAKENRINEDPRRNHQAQALLAHMATGALPIDEDHASLGMVYTNQKDGDEVKEGEE